MKDSLRKDFAGLEKLAIICMTKDRYFEFKHVLQYWLRYPVQLIVADGSENSETEEYVELIRRSGKFHPKFQLVYQRDQSFPARFRWISSQISRPYSAFNNDDDFLYAPNVEKVIWQLEEKMNINGIYSWRNFSLSYISKRSSDKSSQGVCEIRTSDRLVHCLDSEKNLPDAIWLSVQRSEVVKNALYCAFSSSMNSYQNDRLSANGLSVAFILACILSGRYLETRLCLFYKRSFDVKADWTLAHPTIGLELYKLRAQTIVESIIKTLNFYIDHHSKLNDVERDKYLVKNVLSTCSAFNAENCTSRASIFRRAKEKIILLMRSAFRSISFLGSEEKLQKIRPIYSSRIRLEWIPWNIWLVFHRSNCCRDAYTFLQRFPKN